MRKDRVEQRSVSHSHYFEGKKTRIAAIKPGGEGKRVFEGP